MKHHPLLLPPNPGGRAQSEGLLFEERLFGDALQDLPDVDPLEEALAEVDEIVAWSEHDGFSHGDLTQIVQVEDGLEDDDEGPPTVRSPSGIRLAANSSRPIAVLSDDEEDDEHVA